MQYFIRFLLLFCLIQLSHAESIDAKVFSTESEQNRYRSLIDEIRCPVCQGQSIGGSNASLAKDLRNKVRLMIISNNSDNDIRKFMTDRYGDFVVFKPPINNTTYILWITPFVFLFTGIIILFRSLKNRQNDATENQIDTSKAEELLKKKG
jgi:cytochrome c-type biogenesis protein CcmH